MKRIAVVVLALLLAIIVSGLRAAPGDAAAGKTVYTKKCGACHGPGGEAKETIARMMKVEMRHLGSKEVQAMKDEDLKKAIVAGKGKMKGVTGMSDADVANLIAFIRTLKQ